jgi:two-component system heavy metal sensor histidine kinase CusS
LLALGLVVASSVEQHFVDLDMEVLAGKMDLIRQTVAHLKSADELNHLAHQLDHSLVGHHGLEVLVLGPDKTPLFATGNAAFSAQQVTANARRYPERPLKPMVWTQAGQTFRVVTAELTTDLPGKLVAGTAVGQVRDVYQPHTVQVAVATNLAHHQVYMDSFLRTLWLFVAGAASLTGLLGWIAVRSGLKPLHAMREQTLRITAQQLSRRLSVDAVPQELADLAQSLNDMLARLEEAFKRLSEFSSDIAHELRTPVSNLMTQTQVALSRPRSADEYRGILESNAEELERMARMISDMLLLAKADNGLVIPNRESLNLADEVRTLFDYYDALAEEKQVTLTLRGEAQIRADRLMLRRAVGNLLSNALRHASLDSELIVQLETLADAVQIHVTNRGTTIAPDHLDRVFDRFFRVDPARQHNAEGVGLGLAITKSIITAHGGTINVVSGDGETTFCLRLPAQ